MEKTVILVVENEAIIRMGTVQLLQDAGYKVLDAANADIAIGILESRGDIKAVLTDVRMPGSLCGLRLVHLIQNRWPPIHLIVTSGLKPPAEDAFPRKARFIAKPYAPRQVLRVLDEFFSSDPAPTRHSGNGLHRFGTKVA